MPRNSKTGSGHEPAPGTGCSLRTFIVISVGGLQQEEICRSAAVWVLGCSLPPVLSRAVAVAFQPEGKGKRLPEVYCIVSRLGCFNLFSKVSWHSLFLSPDSLQAPQSDWMLLSGLVIAAHPRRVVLPLCLCFEQGNKILVLSLSANAQILQQLLPGRAF